MEKKAKDNLTKVVIALALMVPWAIYQLMPILEKLVVSEWEIVLTILMIAGIITFATIEKAEKKISLSKKVKLNRL